MIRFRWELPGLLCIALLAAAPARAELLIGNASALSGPVSWYGE
jgi:hypothetical protein